MINIGKYSIYFILILAVVLIIILDKVTETFDSHSDDPNSNSNFNPYINSDYNKPSIFTSDYHNRGCQVQKSIPLTNGVKPVSTTKNTVKNINHTYFGVTAPLYGEDRPTIDTIQRPPQIWDHEYGPHCCRSHYGSRNGCVCDYPPQQNKFYPF